MRFLDFSDYFFAKLFPAPPFLAQVIPGPNEAVFYFFPGDGTFNVDDNFSVDLRVNTSAAIASVKAYLNFDYSFISVTDIDITDSAFSVWWENTYNNSTGEIQLQASMPSPGFIGDGLIAKINFLAINSGTANVTYDSVSLVLKPDDTNILNLTRSAEASFIISSPPPPPPNGGGGGGDGSGTPPPSNGIVPPPSIIGDFNNDGKINIYDLSILLSNWKTTKAEYDLNQDGKIDIFDLSILFSNWTG